jgi:hypothetical protein
MENARSTGELNLRVLCLGGGDKCAKHSREDCREEKKRRAEQNREKKSREDHRRNTRDNKIVVP